MTVPERKSSGYRLWKRLLDIVVSLSVLLCCLPLLIALAALIIIFSGRPALFIQTRTGTNNKRFRMFKFRTMTVSRHNEKRHTYNWDEGVPDSFQFKTESDTAVTPIGKFLRKYSLDELPQLLNVLVGHMSLVGPRPEMTSITNLYNSHQVQRLLVKPGITGYAQINGRSEINHGKKVEYDLYYVKNCSLLFDMKIIAATIIYVIRAKGAY
ncbi:sugar transferase [Sporosarcina sp. ANT_H38]|nr:sugar transferase [Sporosarcina sp. ANT_H38]KAA0944383.1 sugar transferase [Sporosarcina sp. ANT_H38]